MEVIINKEKLLTQKILKELLHYDSDSGLFTWFERSVSMFSHCKNPQRACNTWNTRYADQEAGNIYKSKRSKTSYLRVKVTLNGKGRRYGAHRLVFLYIDGHFPPKDIDHIDGDGLNNRRDNLREVTHQENLKNQPMYSNNTSGVAGVYWDKSRQKWRAQIRVNGKDISGGRFTNKADAITRRKKLEIEYGFHKNHGRKTKMEIK